MADITSGNLTRWSLVVDSCNYFMAEGSLEVKLRTIWTDEKQRWEESEKRREEERRSKKRKSQKKEDPGARKGRKVAKHCVFPMVCSSGGSKSRLAKAAGAEPFGQTRDEKLHAVVARRCAKHISKSKCTKHLSFGALLQVHACSIFKHATKPSRFLTFDAVHNPLRLPRETTSERRVFHILTWKCALRATTACTFSTSHLPKVVWAWCVLYILSSKRASRHNGVHFFDGTFEEDLQRYISVAVAVQETCSSEMLGGPGADFLRGVAFWSIRSSGLLRWFCVDRCSTSYDLASLFPGRRNTLGSTLDRWSRKIAKRIGTRPSALHSTFHFWRKSRRIVSFLMLSSSKVEEVSQKCFVCDVVKLQLLRFLDVAKLKKWGGLAELPRFQAYS